ncbi:hypothetical protein ACEPPN_004111 [Leptodophora sp. 'Broadleaf-Isolate-01']
MDPLSVTASVVGLLAAAGKVAMVLSKVRVTELGGIFSTVQKLLSAISSTPRRPIAMIQVEQLIATLTEAVLTLSELDALVTPLGACSSLPLLEHLKFAWKKDVITNIMLRLDRHKSSLSVMLNIIQCKSDLEAEQSQNMLQDLVQQILESNHDISRRLRNIEDAYDSESIQTACFRNGIAYEPDDAEVIPNQRASLQTNRISSGHLTGFQYSFEIDLKTSRVYRRTEPYDSDASFTSSAVRAHAWSIFSKLSLSQVSNISAIALPVYSEEIFNTEAYGYIIPEQAVLAPEATSPGLTPADSPKIVTDLTGTDISTLPRLTSPKPAQAGPPTTMLRLSQGSSIRPPIRRMTLYKLAVLGVKFED